MNILVVTSSFPKYRNSHEVRFILELAEGVSKNGLDPIVLAPHFPGGKLRESWGHVQIRRFVYFFPTRFEQLAYGPGILYNVQRNILAVIGILPFCIIEFLFTIIIVIDKKISLIHSQWIIPQGFIGALLHKLIKIPHLLTVHGSDLTFLGRHPALTPLTRFIVSNSDVVTVNSNYMKEQLAGIVPEYSQKIRVIPMGILPGTFQVREFSDIKSLLRTNHLILSVGRLIDWKGTIYLIEAMTDVIKRFPDSLLMIAGAGPEKETLVRRCRELGLEKNVTFSGTLRTEDLPSYYQSADVFVLPSVNKSGRTEALGVVLLEAMASGCPVIGSNVGGIPDIITDGENGFLVPEQSPEILAEKIVQILSNPDLKRKFRINGRETAQKLFSWESISYRFSEVYDEILERYSEKGSA